MSTYIFPKSWTRKIWLCHPGEVLRCRGQPCSLEWRLEKRPFNQDCGNRFDRRQDNSDTLHLSLIRMTGMDARIHKLCLSQYSIQPWIISLITSYSASRTSLTLKGQIFFLTIWLTRCQINTDPSINAPITLSGVTVCRGITLKNCLIWGIAESLSRTKIRKRKPLRRSTKTSVIGMNSLTIMKMMAWQRNLPSASTVSKEDKRCLMTRIWQPHT